MKGYVTDPSSGEINSVTDTTELWSIKYEKGKGLQFNNDVQYQGESVIFSDGSLGTLNGDVIPSAVSNGIQSFAFGGTRWDYLNLEGTEYERKPTSAEGNQSLAIGGSSHAHGDWSIALGKDCETYGKCSFSLGGGSIAGSIASNSEYQYSIAMGELSEATGKGAVAIGSRNKVTLYYGTAFGELNTVLGSFNFVAGYLNNTQNYSSEIGLGYKNNIKGNYAVAIGNNNSSLSTAAISIGSNNENKSSYGTAIGRNNVTANDDGIVIGRDNSNTGWYALNLGRSNVTSGSNSATVGYKNTNEQGSATIVGYNNYIHKGTTPGSTNAMATSTAIGNNNKIYGSSGIAIGQMNNVGDFNNAEPAYSGAMCFGYNNYAYAQNSVSIGVGNSNRNANCVAIGRYSSSSIKDEDYAFIVGSGTPSTRRNSILVRGDNGDVELLQKTFCENLYSKTLRGDEILIKLPSNVYGSVASDAALKLHITDKDNPHEVTLADVKGNSITLNGVKQADGANVEIVAPTTEDYYNDNLYYFSAYNRITLGWNIYREPVDLKLYQIDINNITFDGVTGLSSRGWITTSKITNSELLPHCPILIQFFDSKFSLGIYMFDVYKQKYRLFIQDLTDGNKLKEASNFNISQVKDVFQMLQDDGKITGLIMLNYPSVYKLNNELIFYNT